MDNLAGYFIQRRVTSWLVTLLLGLGGLIAFVELGRLEDPAFTLKTAIITVQYPGASPQQVEEEVTYPLENAIQQLPYIDKIRSISSNGLTQITVDVQNHYGPDDLPQIWDELRRKVNDLAPRLPPGVQTPVVNDDFGDVFGIWLNISGAGYSYQELRDFADLLRRELVLVEGIGKGRIGYRRLFLQGFEVLLRLHDLTLECIVLVLRDLAICKLLVGLLCRRL